MTKCARDINFKIKFCRGWEKIQKIVFLGKRFKFTLEVKVAVFHGINTLKRHHTSTSVLWFHWLWFLLWNYQKKMKLYCVSSNILLPSLIVKQLRLTIWHKKNIEKDIFLACGMVGWMLLCLYSISSQVTTQAFSLYPLIFRNRISHWIYSEFSTSFLFRLSSLVYLQTNWQKNVLLSLQNGPSR